MRCMSLIFAASIMLSSPSEAQEFSFEYGEWESSEWPNAFVRTYVWDAENHFGISCGANPSGIDVQYVLKLASDDQGNLLENGWLRAGPIRVEMSRRGEVIGALDLRQSELPYEARAEDWPYGEAGVVAVDPVAGSEGLFDEHDVRFVSAIMRADKITFKFGSGRTSMVVSFSGTGSSTAIRQTSWCNPEEELW